MFSAEKQSLILQTPDETWLSTDLMLLSNVRGNLGNGTRIFKYWHCWNIFMAYSISGAKSLEKSMTPCAYICE